MKTIAEEKTGMDLFYEICIKNVDKPPSPFIKLKKLFHNLIPTSGS